MSKKLQNWLYFLIVTISLGIIIGTVLAAPDQNYNDRMKETLQNLTDKGYDVSQIQTAMDSGNSDNVRTMMNQFWQQHPETRPQVSLDRVKQSVQNLSAKGYDISQIQVAIDRGDTTNASTLLNQFWQAHPEARPTFNSDPTQIKSRIDHLKQQGIDVAEIQQVYDSGDMNKTRDLIRQASPRPQRSSS